MNFGRGSSARPPRRSRQAGAATDHQDLADRWMIIFGLASEPCPGHSLEARSAMSPRLRQTGRRHGEGSVAVRFVHRLVGCLAA